MLAPERLTDGFIAIPLLGAFALVALFVLTQRYPHPVSPKFERLLLVLAFSPLGLVTYAWFGPTERALIRFERDWGTVLATCAALYGLWRLRRGRVLRKGGQKLHDGLVTGAAISLGLGLSGLELRAEQDHLSVIALVDRSRSTELADHAELRIARELAVAELSMTSEDQIAVLSFASGARLEMPLRRRAQPHSPQKANIARGSTDIEHAIRQGLLELPSGSQGKLVLLSDGVATRGDLSESVSAAVASNVPIDVVALEQKPINNVRVVSLRGPSTVSRGEVFDLQVVVESPTAQTLTLRLFEEDVLVRSGPLDVGAGQELVSLRHEANGVGLSRFQVQLSAEEPSSDQLSGDNQRSTFVKIRGSTTALILSRDPALNAPLEAALRAAAITVDNLSFGSAPMSVSDIAGYDLVVLGDIPAHLFTPAQLGAFAAQVRALGGGLLLLGSDQSMGPGGYAKTSIEEVSPVSFDLKQDRRRGTLAQVIAIDYSGSMGASVGSETKLTLANSAAARSYSLLAASDQLGVMHVDTAVRWTVPLGPISGQKKLKGALEAVTPGGGGVYVDLSLKAAYRKLKSATSNLKHVVLFADGSDAEERSEAEFLAQGALRAKITTSVVALGRGPDVPALESLSQAGAGRFYLIEDAERLPAVFAQETILAARSSLNEITFTPTLKAASGPLRGVDLSAMPALDGYVVTLPKARSEVYLVGPDSDPLLASWSVGLGRAAAFTSDFSGRWSQAWTSWPGAAQLFAQLGRTLARGTDDPNFRLRADASGGRIKVDADVISQAGFADSYRKLQVQLLGPDGSAQALVLNATAPGRYSASMRVERPGAYVVSAFDLDTEELLGTTGTELHPADELSPTGTDYGVLRAIARDTGGRVRTSLEGLFRERMDRRFGYRALAFEALFLGGFLLVLAVAARRLLMPQPVRDYLTSIQEVFQPRTVPSAPQESLVQQLSRAKGARQAADFTDAAPASSAPAPFESITQEEPVSTLEARPRKRPARPSGSKKPELTAAQILLARRRKP